MRQRVLLVKSRYFIDKNTGTSPPLGLMYLGSYLRDRQNSEVRIIDLKFVGDGRSAVVRAMRDFRPHVVGISAVTVEAEGAYRCARAVKETDARIPVVLGGPHATALHEEVLGNADIDIAVMGEGEHTFGELVEVLGRTNPKVPGTDVLRAIKGIACRDETGRAMVTEPRPYIRDLDTLPFPAWDLVDLPRYWKRRSMASLGIRPYVSLLTSRGCPYQCVNCHNLFGKQFRVRSPENVLQEIILLRDKYGMEDIEVIDDIANFDRSRFNTLLCQLLEGNLHPMLSFPNGVRADLLEEDTISLLKQVGVGEVSVAIETASSRLQKLIRKRLDIDRASHSIDLLAKNRIFTRGFFMLGIPSETEGEMRSTIEFACQSRMHLALFFQVIPFKGTPMYDLFRKHGKRFESDKVSEYEFFGSSFNGSEVPYDRFQSLVRQAYLRFYSDPRRWYRIARDRPYKKDLPRSAGRLVINMMTKLNMADRDNRT